jgi:hypothetical protein
MPETREEILKKRRKLRAEYGALYTSLAMLLFRADPIGISFDNTEDEYEPEAGTILPRLRNCQSADDVLQVVHQEFVRWFDPVTAGPKQHYAQIASEIWQLWQSRLRDSKSAPPESLP